jgi:integrase
MPRAATGQVVVDERRRSPTFGLRFRAYGKREYVTLGTADEGWTRAKAQTELQNVLADVRRGIWRPVEPKAHEIDRDPTFHEFASRWFDATKGEWRPKTVLDYEWQLSCHLLPFFRQHRLSQITIAEVDRYRQAQVRRGALSVTSINKTITRLGQILEVAVEYGLIERNPAKGRRRRLKAVRPTPVWLDRAEHVEALLDAAGELDRHAKIYGGHDQKGGLVYRRTLLATLVFAGLRIGELTALRWRDVDLAGNRITVHMSKTDAGVRQIDLLPVLHNELTVYRAQALNATPDGLVFATAAHRCDREVPCSA